MRWCDSCWYILLPIFSPSCQWSSKYSRHILSSLCQNNVLVYKHNKNKAAATFIPLSTCHELEVHKRFNCSWSLPFSVAVVALMTTKCDDYNKNKRLTICQDDCVTPRANENDLLHALTMPPASFRKQLKSPSYLSPSSISFKGHLDMTKHYCRASHAFTTAQFLNPRRKVSKDGRKCKQTATSKYIARETSVAVKH